MTHAEESIQLPDGEELVVIEYPEWPTSDSRPDPREASLSLRRQAVQPPPKPHAPVVTS